MSRELEVGADLALQDRHVSQVVFLELDFLSGVSRVCTREHSIDWNSQTWLGAGRVGAIEPIGEGGELEARGIAMSVSALPAGLLALALTPSEYKGREVRLWFGQMAEERYLALPGSAGNLASSDDSAGASVTGDIDIRTIFSLDDYTPATINTILAKGKWDAPIDAAYGLNVLTDGKLQFIIGDSASTSAGISSTAATGLGAGVQRGFKITRTQADGVVTFSVSEDYDRRTGSGTWTPLGTPVVLAAGTAIHDSTRGLLLGNFQDGQTQPMAGKLHYAEVRNGIGGPIVTQFDASLMDPAQTSAPMPTGELWTIHQSGSPAARIVRDPLAVVADPVGPFIFRMDQLTWQLGGELASLRLTAESRLADWHRPRVRRYNNADHQALHPGDKFFEHVEHQIEAVHRW